MMNFYLTPVKNSYVLFTLNLLIVASLSNVLEAQGKFIGTMNNVVVFIRFADQEEFTESFQFIDEFLNSSIKPSVKTYYAENSGHQLTIQSHFFPAPDVTNDKIVSYQDSHPMDYFRPYDAINNSIGYQGIEGSEREDRLLADALLFVKDEIESASLDLDINNDEIIDNISFIIQRPPGGAFSTYLYPTLIQITDIPVYIQGKKAYMGNKHTTEYLQQEQLGFFCHEMFHGFTFAPDIYNSRSVAFSPVGVWDLMGGGGGTMPPAHLLVYMKMKYGTWLETIPRITKSGTYTLECINDNPLAAYEIPSPNSTHEKFIVEYRKPVGMFESGLGRSQIECGLLIYRVDDRYSGCGGGEPYFEVYVFRPLYGDRPEEGDSNKAGFAVENGRTTFSSETNPSCFLNDGSVGGIMINNITSNHGSTISFNVVVQDNSTDIENVKEQDLIIYPNPVNDIFYIKNNDKGLNIKVLNNSGEVLFEQKINNQCEIIDVSGLKSGLYMMQLIDVDENVMIRKFIKK
ncbi:MAG: T9SS type A sorting domain-containing protein [Marinilabiliaceae bacterium]|nr:T9SS type A sorting domain-containing protein [Marinilabiliaceae bacterium]